MRKQIIVFSAAVLCGSLAAACSPSGHAAPQDAAEQEPASDQEQQEAAEEDSGQEKEEDSSSNASLSNWEGEEAKTSGNSEEAESTDPLRDQLNMEKSAVKLPTSFPEENADSVNPEISTNQAQTYTVQYHNENNKLMAEMSAKQYENAEQSVAEIQSYRDGKQTPPYEEGKVDLGHGLTGYTEGAAGNVYLSWEEGNWLIVIHSLTQDQLDQPALARQMVDDLEKYTLPAPDEKGCIFVDYEQGDDDVTVDIRWQEGANVYQLNTEEDPLNALHMAVSIQ
ncbi:hypothetical protein [Salibacterium aidingense]|uniref:hypothetical protein n=1 Tax=Salibacterium aidingense TaxID=384933 RepID=UPI003BE678F9